MARLEYHCLCPMCGRSWYGFGGYFEGKDSFLRHLRTRHGTARGWYVDAWIRYVTAPPSFPRKKRKQRSRRKKKIGFLGY